jgi:hypothetical protein
VDRSLLGLLSAMNPASPFDIILTFPRYLPKSLPDPYPLLSCVLFLAT